jgi:type I restriction enzyme S subunit
MERWGDFWRFTTLSARRLFEEWFVRFRFPGHERVKIKDGVPEGWEKGCVGRLANVSSGFAFKSKDWRLEGNPVIKIKNIVGDGTVDTVNCDCVNDRVAEAALKFEIPIGTLLIAMTGATVGKVGIMPNSSTRFFLNQRVGLFKNNFDYPLERFLFPFFQGGFAQTQIQNLSGGAAQPNISGSQIESIELLVPDKRILSLYLEATDGIFKQRKNLLDQNGRLAQARDLLLPRLMNGEIKV